MSAELTEDQASLQETVRRYLQEKAPLSRVREQASNARGYEDEYWRQVAELGFTSMLVPEGFGGGSLTSSPLVDLAIVAEEIGRGVAAGPFIGCNVVADALARSTGDFGEVLSGLAAGELTAAWALAEGAHWEPAAFDAEIVEVAGQRVLRGRKDWVESAESVDYFLVTARDGSQIVQVLVPAEAVGVKVEPLQALDLVRRFAAVVFDDVIVPEQSVVSAGESTAADVEHQLQVAVTLACAETAGAVERAFEMLLEYAQTRVTFGRQIGSYQALKHRLADHKLWLEASFGLTEGLAAAVSIGDPASGKLASMAKAHVSERSVETLQDCVQMFGGIGLTWEHDIHLFLRRAAINYSLYGTPADHRERLCALAGL
jgi:alkylation response protein AidB-like acyl-CoA dehydrogenase